MYRKGFKFFLLRIIRILFAISFVLPTFFTAPENITFAQGDHFFLVRHDQEQIHCNGWAPGETITLNVDDPVPGSPDYTETGVVWDDGSYNFELAGIYDILPGFIISVSNGGDTLVHTVQDLWITFVNMESDRVYGTATPGSDVYFEIPAYDGNFGAYRHEIADSAGAWVADYSTPGDEPEEGENYDIRPGDSGEAYQHQGDAWTYVSFDIPNPQFQVDPSSENLWGNEWTPNGSVTITVDQGSGPVNYGSFGLDSNGNFGTGLSVNLQATDVVVVTDTDDPAISKEHTITNLAVGEVDEANDTVSGTADAGSGVHVWVDNTNVWRNVVACGDIVNPCDGTDPPGTWHADFNAEPGDPADGEGTFNLVAGTSGGSQQCDTDDDCTQFHWQIANPQFQVDPSSENLWGNEWTPDGQVTVTVNDAEVPGSPFELDENGNFGTGFDPSTLDFTAGDIVTVFDGTTTKTHTITSLKITGVDHVSDTVSGLAEPGTTIDVWVHGSAAWLQVVACDNDGYPCVGNDPLGTWHADFSGQANLQPGMNGNSSQCDVDNDCTMGGWYVQNPTFAVRPDGDNVNGWDWAPNHLVTVTFGGSPSFTTQTDDSGYFELNLDGAYDIVPGIVVEVTDDVHIKNHTVTSLTIDSIDVDLDRVYGSATANAQVQVWVCWENDCANRWETADGAGDWWANFSVAGNEAGEELTADIQPGTWVDSGEWDDDGDNTNAGYTIPNPRFAVRPNGDNVNGWDWTPNVQIDVTFDGGPPHSTETDDSGYFELNLDGAYDIVPGIVVEVTDDVHIKNHTVTSLTIDSIDVDLDRVYGSATANAQVQVWVCWENDCANRWETADSTGDWWANFSIAGTEAGEEQIANIVPGTWVDSGEWDADGDNTNAGYNVPNPSFAVRLFDAQVDGWEWPLGAVVTMTIDDPATSQTPDYTDTNIVVVAEWDPNQTSVRFDFSYLYFIQPGHIVTLNDGVTTKVHTVIDLGITDVDMDAETVSGTTDLDAQVDVWICEEWGCVNRHVSSDGGIWSADFQNPGPQEDEQDTYDIVPGTRGDVSQSDPDGDRTEIWWSVADPRLEVSYEHDWVQIRDFMPDGQVTYTIYDHEEGHALFGPITGPVDSHGDGWISSNLHHTDLVPGNYITAVDEASGEEVSLTIRNLNLDYVGIQDDRAFGTTEPGASIELNISETYNQGFNLMATADGSGYWEVDLAAAGHPIDTYRHANIQLYDAEGNSITAQSPRVHAQVRSDNMSVDNFSKNADVTMELYESQGGNSIYGPATLRTEGSGSAWVNLWEHGIDLIPGMYITAYDHNLNFTKSLEIEPFTFEEMNTANDIVRGTSIINEWVELHVESLFSNWGLDAQTGSDNQWSRNYGVEGYDLTDQMWAYGWAVDDQGNWSQDHITGLPNIEASVASDWISGFNFSPDRPVRVEIYDSDGVSLLAQVETIADGNTQFYVDYWEHGIDLQPGMYLYVVDLETGKNPNLVLAHLTFDGVDYGADTAWGQADEGSQVVVRADWFFEHYEVAVVADENDEWFVDFAPLGADLTPEWGLRAMIFDLELDATVADAPRPPDFTASLDGNWINGNNWTPDENVTIEVFPSADPGAERIFGPQFVSTDGQGNFHYDLWQDGFEFTPDQYVQVTDQVSGITKVLVVAGLSIDWVDYENELAGGFAPPEVRLNIGAGNGDWNEFDLFSESDSTWTADFGLHDIDLTQDKRIQLRHNDEDGDATQVEWWIPNPNLVVMVDNDQAHGHDWPNGAEVTMTIDDPETSESPDLTMVATAYEDEPGHTWVEFDFSGQFDVLPEHTVTFSDNTTTKEHIVTRLAVYEVDFDNETVSGIAEPDGNLQIDVFGEGPPLETIHLTADGGGNWTANFLGLLNINEDNWIMAHEYDDDDDSTIVIWELQIPPFYCDPGTSISGYITEVDGATPLEWATVHIEDFHTGEELYYVDADENGFYSCDLPDAEYRVWAEGGGWDGTMYSREYYEEAIFESATSVVVLDGSENSNVNFTLDTPVVVYDHFTFNMEDDVITSDPAVRQAVAFGTDRLRIIQETFPASPLMHTFLNPDHWAADDLVTQYEFDPDQAQEILDAAGWVDGDEDGFRERGGQSLRIVYYTSQAEFRATIADIFTENMADIGVEVEVNAVPWGDFVNQVFDQHDFGIAQFAWGFDVNDDTWPGSIFQTDVNNNPGLYSDQTVDGLLGDALDYGTRLEKRPRLHQVQQIVMGDLATLPLLMRVEAQPPEFREASIDPNPVAVEQEVTITATFEAFHGPIVAIEYFTDVSDGWVSMEGVAGDQLIDTGTATASFDTAGVYSIFVRAQDDIGNWSAPSLAGILAVYDPSDGFVTGGGQIVPGGKTSYDDDYLPNIDGESPAVFGFNVKYKKGTSTVPSGHILFQYHRGDLKLQSSDFDWLVITNSVWAKFKGTATIDGYEGLFPFRVDARDSDKLGGSQDDRFIIRIWEPGSDPDHDDPIYKASGDVQGQIVIHDKKDPIFMLGALFEYSAGLDLTFASNNAVQMAVHQANEAGGVLGSEVLAYYRDAGDGGSFDVTRDSALDLIEARGVQALIGPGFSSNTQAILEEIVIPSQVLMASPSNTAPGLAEIPDDGLYFRTVESDHIKGRASALRAYDSGFRSAVVILQDEPFISEVAQEFMNAFQGYGGQILRVASFEGDPSDTIQQAFGGLDTLPDVVYVAVWERNDVVNLVQHALCQTNGGGQRASQSYWSMGFDYILDEAFVADVSGWNQCGLAPEFVEDDLVGYEQVSPAFAYDLGHDDFQDAYSEAFSQDPTNFANTAYDAAVLVMLAAEEAGTTDPTAIREHMLSVSSGGTPVSNFTDALEMVRDGEDIDWQGTYAGQVDGFSYEINHDFEPDGETINPFLVLQIVDGVSVEFVDTVSDADLHAEGAQISLYIARTMANDNLGELLQAAHQLGAMLEDVSGQTVSTFVPPGDSISSQQSTITALKRGVADLAMLNWLTHLVAYETAGAEIGLTNFRFGQPYYLSQVWTHKETGFTTLTDLEGVPVCYVDPSSASGYIIPSLMLMAEGLDPFENANIVGSHPGVIEALYHQQCDGGASFFDARDMLVDTYPVVKDVVLPLELSPQIPNEGFSFAAHVPDNQRDAVVSALLDVSSTAGGLEQLTIISGGSEGLVQTDQSIYSGLEDLIADAGLTASEVWENYYH